MHDWGDLRFFLAAARSGSTLAAARELGVNHDHNLFGPGWRANATIGRAIRLCLINIGGGNAKEPITGYPMPLATQNAARVGAVALVFALGWSTIATLLRMGGIGN